MEQVSGALAAEAAALALSDAPPPPRVRGPGRSAAKGPSPKDTAPRKPYRVYTSLDGA